jgi:hypothetical protein
MQTSSGHSALSFTGIISLPQEILLIIFEISAEDDLRRDGNHAIQPVLSISLVNRSWRELTFTHPALWSYVRFDFGAGPKSSLGSTTVLRTMLERSNMLPLSLSVNTCHSYSIFPDRRRLDSAFSLLQPCLRRTRFLRVIIHEGFASKVERFFVGQEVPLLNTLDLRSRDSVAYYHRLGHSPKLSEVRLENVMFQNNEWHCGIHKLHVSAPNGPVFGGDGLNLSDLFKIRATLVHLRLDDSCLSLDCAPSPATHPIVLAQLVSLGVHNVPEWSISLFFQHISTPSIQVLEFSGKDSVDALLGSLDADRSLTFANVHTLSLLPDSWTDETHLVHLPRAFPSVRNTILLADVGKHAIAMLNMELGPHATDTSVSWRRLESLTLSVRSSFALQRRWDRAFGDQILTFVIRRLDVGRPLNQLRLVMDRVPAMHFPAALRDSLQQHVSLEQISAELLDSRVD